jgi:predicted RNA methylase
MLGIACALIGCPQVLGVDIDTAALSQAHANVSNFPGLEMDLLQADVCSSAGLPFRTGSHADIVIMNPPFGSWRKGADCEFLSAAFKVSIRTLWYVHVMLNTWSGMEGRRITFARHPIAYNAPLLPRPTKLNVDVLKATLFLVAAHTFKFCAQL